MQLIIIRLIKKTHDIIIGYQIVLFTIYAWDNSKPIMN